MRLRARQRKSELGVQCNAQKPSRPNGGPAAEYDRLNEGRLLRKDFLCGRRSRVRTTRGRRQPERGTWRTRHRNGPAPRRGVVPFVRKGERLALSVGESGPTLRSSRYPPASSCGNRFPGGTFRARLLGGALHARLAAEPERLRQVGSTGGIIRRNERIIALQIESSAVLAGCQLMGRLQVALERFESLSAA
jgi:hypothetical protein